MCAEMAVPPGKDPFTPALSQQARPGERAPQKSRIRERMPVGEGAGCGAFQKEGANFKGPFSARGEGQGEGGLESWLKARAQAEGFGAVGIAAPGTIREAGAELYAFLEAGFHGGMDWLVEKADRRADPAALWPEVRSIVMLGMSYGPAGDPLAAARERSRAAISVYAQGLDYHDVVKRKLKAVARDFAKASGADVKVFVDTAPVMEKPLAQGAGLGWQGKHTNLVSRGAGSWLFLGAIFTTAALTPDAPESNRCGSCRRCIDICPTRAFPAPYRIDARRCISYLTIEHKEQIPLEFRERLGNRIYGCDDCLGVCPWNKFARTAREAKFAPLPGAANPALEELLTLNDAAFRARFRGSPVKRTGRERFVRNVLVAAGNSGEPALLPTVTALLGDASPLVRGMAAWAVRRLANKDLAEVLKARHCADERDAGVLAEWDCAL
jgi:epoxyqueuosine reductase